MDRDLPPRDIIAVSGGYPILGYFAQRDLPELLQLVPGSRVKVRLRQSIEITPNARRAYGKIDPDTLAIEATSTMRDLFGLDRRTEGSVEVASGYRPYDEQLVL